LLVVQVRTCNTSVIFYYFNIIVFTFCNTVSLISLAVIALLVFSEFLYYLEVNRMDVLYVDTSEEMKIPINLNITFPAISCDGMCAWLLHNSCIQLTNTYFYIMYYFAYSSFY